jgi:hypothetical protein
LIQFDFLFDPEEKDQKTSPHGFILMPVYSTFVEENNPDIIVGFLIGVTVFSNLFDRLLPEGTDGIIAVLSGTCGKTMSFELSAGKAYFLGYEDLHEPEFDEYERFEPNIEMYEDVVDGLCVHDLHIYPSSSFRQTFETNTPYVYMSVVALAFFLTAILLVVYDMMVNRRQNKTIRAVSRTQAIVTSLFPKEIGKKLVEQACEDSSDSKVKNAWKKKHGHGKAGLQSIVGKNGELLYGNQGNLASSKPLADLFPEATVMFADIVGFTAWSSMREPSQVFMLLEGLYSSFDEVALRRKVFKVETGKFVPSSIY